MPETKSAAQNGQIVTRPIEDPVQQRMARLEKYDLAVGFGMRMFVQLFVMPMVAAWAWTFACLAETEAKKNMRWYLFSGLVRMPPSFLEFFAERIATYCVEVTNMMLWGCVLHKVYTHVRVGVYTGDDLAFFKKGRFLVWIVVHALILCWERVLYEPVLVYPSPRNGDILLPIQRSNWLWELFCSLFVV